MKQPNIPIPQPPVARAKPHRVDSPNGSRDDEYHWLRDDTRQSKEVISYLQAENAYKDALLAPLAAKQATLYEEIVGRIADDDATVPYRSRGYWYYRRYESGKQYAIHARKRDVPDAVEEVLLDVNALAADTSYYRVGRRRISQSNRMLAYAEDKSGRRQYSLRFKDLQSGDTLPDKITGTNGSFVWMGDNRSLLYIEQDPKTLLGVRVKRHVLGDAVSSDTLVYEETDRSFYMGLGETGDHEYLILHLGSTETDEVRVLKKGDADPVFRTLVAREAGHEYSVDRVNSKWVIRTNWRAKNFRLVQSTDANVSERDRWQEVVPHRGDVLVSGYELFQNFLVVSERADGTRRLRVKSWDGRFDYLIDSTDPAYAMHFGVNSEQSATALRYSYDSLTTPTTIYEIDLETRKRKLLKRQPVPGYVPERYLSERLWATARDGVKVPISLVYRKGTPLDGSAPVYQYAYGAYGHATDPYFRSSIVSLLDRGVVFAIAHVRGGDEMGRDWYDSGRKLNKINTFADFIDVTEFLVEQRYADPKRVVAAGGSAGGLLVAAVANMRPELYNTIVAHVPFVDVVTTMLDESIPLTTNEFDEWGDPKQSEYYKYMLRYSPYDNIKSVAYPALFITTGLWDSQVQYFEPAKWVARLRAKSTGSKPIVFHINMEAGHGGKSGRFRAQRERAMEYAFVLDRLQVPRD